MKIYSIDDDQINNFLTEKVVKQAGLEVSRFFLSAEDALNYLKENDCKNLPDIILLDLNMPEMSGWQFLDALEPYKENIVDKCHIYILTSSLDTSDVSRSQSYSSVSGFIHKPLTVEDVQVVMAEIKEKYIK